MSIEVKSPTHVMIDGSNSGKVVDTMVNHRSRASEVQIALEAWYAAEIAKRQDKENKDKAEAARAIQVESDRLSGEIDSLQEQNNQLRDEIKSLQQLVDALGGTELGQKMAKEKRAKELKAQIEASKAELDSLTKTVI